ncbi:MAG: MBOAT family protein [Alcanivoracaceae bacterium]|nr:MBOAT family protein [Alcanivoracaceae bacterium]
MVFTSPTFLFAFLPVALFLYYLVPRNIKNSVLLLASLFFYAWGELAFVLVLIFSIGVNYIFGRLLYSRQQSKAILLVGVAVNLLLLGFYKYFHFLLLNLGIDSDFSQSIHLPLGISFFTFQAISYLVDIKRGQSKPQKNIINLGLYISFFPQLIAGPIVRYNNIAKQLLSRIHSNELFVAGVERFSYGLAKKIIIANAMGAVADPIFALDSSQLSMSLAWLAIICYALQIYFDFSAYSDMAIGLGRMFGFQFQENFNYPYIASSLRDFWQRWHISLSRWFRDYLYIPLGGNEKGSMRTYLNLLLVFFLCGFWHGASWNFLLWGMIHGGFLIVERIGLAKMLEKVPVFIRHIYTLLVVLVAWVFFRIEDISNALDFVAKMFYFQHEDSYLYSYHYFINNQFLITVVFALILCTPISKRLVTYYPSACFMGSAIVNLQRGFVVLSLLLLSVILVSASTYNPFIYFRF